MNTLPLIACMGAAFLALAIFAPRLGEPKPSGLMPLVIRGLFRWARWWYCLALAVEAGYHRFGQAKAEMAQMEATR